MRQTVIFALLMALCLFTAGDTWAAKKNKSSKNKTLYQRLGGKPAITKVVDDLAVRITKDNLIKRFFASAEANPERLQLFKSRLVDQICEASGGPCKYTGKDMKAAHLGMNIRDAHFNALVGALNASLDKYKVKKKDKAELLAALAPMRPDIVEAPANRGVASDEE